MAAGSNCAFEIAANRCRETWLSFDSSLYRNSWSPNPMVTSSTLYDVPFSQIQHDWHRTVRNDPPRSFKVDVFHIIWKALDDFLLVITSNFGPISHHLWDIRRLIVENAHFFTPNLRMFLHWIAEILHAKTHITGLINRVIIFG